MVLGWNRENVSENALENYITHLKVCNLRAPRGKSLIHSPKMAFGYAYFWMWLFIELTKSRPTVVHSCDLDTVIPCYLYKVLFRKKLVLDVFDRYAMAFVPSKCKLYYSIVNSLEEFFSKRADVLITISEKVLSTFRKKAKKSIVIMNCPEDKIIDKETIMGDRPFRIVFTGTILKKTRGLETIITAIKDLPDVEFIIAGWYLEKDKEFLDKVLLNPNVRYEGLLKPNDSLTLEASSDIMIALYEPQNWNNITLPNKIFEAMMCGVPLITNVASELVNDVGFGIIVKYDDVEELKHAIILLRDDVNLRRKLGLNGRNAYLEKYNWSKMEQILFKTYGNLLPKL